MKTASDGYSEMTAQGRGQMVEQLATRSYWLISRAALPLTVFRAIVGGLLALHFARGSLQVAPLLEASMFRDALAHTALRSVTAPGYRALFACGVVLAILIVLGMAVRASAAILLLLSATLNHALFQISHLDDWIACVMCFWFTLLPAGPGLPALRDLVRRNQPEQRVPGVVVSLLLAHVLAFYLALQLWAAYSPLWQPQSLVTAAACLVPALYLLPSGHARMSAGIVQVGLHGYLAFVTGELLTHGVLMATSLLFWGEPAQNHEAPTARSAKAIDLAAVVAGCYSLTLALWTVSLQFGCEELTHTASTVLEDSGLHPPPLTARLLDAELTFVAHDGTARAFPDVLGVHTASLLPTRLLRTRIIMAAMSRAPAAREMARAELRSAVDLYCAGKIPSEREVIIMLASPELGVAHGYPFASFSCYNPADSLRWRFEPESAAVQGQVVL